MSDEEKSFGELLSEAPLATGENTISLVGALARSHHSGKFVLTLAGNQSVTLDIDAVKKYRVLGGGVGQALVEVEIDRERVPHDIFGGTGYSDVGGIPGPPQNFGPTGSSDVWPTGHHDVPGPRGSGAGTPKGMTWTDEISWVENIPDPSLWGDPWQLGSAYAAPAIPTAAPFALATPHQAPQSTIAAMQGGPILGRTPLWLDGKLPWWDRKLPWLEGITGHPPFLD